MSNNVSDRQSIRLKNYDYSQSGLYSITICTENRKCLFGDIMNEKMILNTIGNMIEKQWNKISERFNRAKLDVFQIMPNHIHGIIQIVGAGFMPARNGGFMPARNKRATTRVTPTMGVTIGDIIGAFKSLTTHEYVMGVKNNGWKPFDKRLWQRNYYEHIIRNEFELNRIREYIVKNPNSWNQDRNNVVNMM